MESPLFQPRRILPLAQLCALPLRRDGQPSNADLVAVVAYIDSSRPRKFYLLDESLCVVVLAEGRAAAPDWITEGDVICVGDAKLTV